MTRTDQKCLVASTGVHGFLLALLLVSPLLIGPARQARDLNILKVIPLKTVDSLFSGGGNPNAAPVTVPAVETP